MSLSMQDISLFTIYIHPSHTYKSYVMVNGRSWGLALTIHWNAFKAIVTFRETERGPEWGLICRKIMWNICVFNVGSLITRQRRTSFGWWDKDDKAEPFGMQWSDKNNLFWMFRMNQTHYNLYFKLHYSYNTNWICYLFCVHISIIESVYFINININFIIYKYRA